MLLIMALHFFKLSFPDVHIGFGVNKLRDSDTVNGSEFNTICQIVNELYNETLEYYNINKKISGNKPLFVCCFVFIFLISNSIVFFV